MQYTEQSSIAIAKVIAALSMLQLLQFFCFCLIIESRQWIASLQIQILNTNTNSDL